MARVCYQIEGESGGYGVIVPVAVMLLMRSQCWSVAGEAMFLSVCCWQLLLPVLVIQDTTPYRDHKLTLLSDYKKMCKTGQAHLS